MIELGNSPLTLAEAKRILIDGEKITLSKKTKEKVQASFDFLQSFSQDKVIYGVNTGFGPMAQYKVETSDICQLQYNLIRSHSTGLGERLPNLEVKAVMLVRLCNLIQGYSGIHPSVSELLTAFINRGIFPHIYQHGGVGASGDLVQLAHLALGLIGEGEVCYQNQDMPTAKALEQAGLQPIEIHLREGLGLMNGTSGMTGVGFVNLLGAKKLLRWSLRASAIINEMFGAYDDYFSKELQQVKHHQGQHTVAKEIRNLLTDSQLIRKRDEHLYQKQEQEIFQEKVQEYYSLRCVPQILGAVHDTIAYAETVLVNEANSVSDNPIVDRENQNVFHGGNFHGDYVALEMDKLKIVVSKLSMLAERQLNYLLNNKLNKKLPPFVNLGVLGLNYGMQGAQFTATSTVAENQTYSYPMYLHSIPNNNDNQDIVSMGFNAAILCKKVIENSFQVLAVQWLTILQAIDYLQVADKLAPANRASYEKLRSLVPVFVEDAIRREDLLKIEKALKED